MIQIPAERCPTLEKILFAKPPRTYIAKPAMISLRLSLYTCTLVSNRARREATPDFHIVIGITMWLSVPMYTAKYVRSMMQHERAAASDSATIIRGDYKLNRTL